MSPDSTVCDGNTATGPDVTNSPPSQVTIAVYAGATITADSVFYTLGYIYNLTHVLEYSLSSTGPWTAIPVTAFAGHAGVFGLESETIAGPFTFAYLRLSISDDGNSGTTSGRASGRELGIRSASLVTYSFAPATTGTIEATRYFNTGAGVINAVAGDGNVCITFDSGGPGTFSKFTGRVAYSHTPSETWESSNDGLSWTPFTVTLQTAYTPGGGVYTEVDQVWTPSAGTVSGQFIRYTLLDHPASSPLISTPGVVAMAANDPPLTGGSFSLSGTITHGDGSPFANATVSICYKAAGAFEIRNCVLQNPTRAGQYCADGDWQIAAVTTDCSGNWTWAGLSNLRAVQIFLGPMRINPAYDKESRANTNGWPNNQYIITDNSVAEWANIKQTNTVGFPDAFSQVRPTGTLTTYNPGGISPTSFTDGVNDAGPNVGSCCGSTAGYGAQILSGILLYRKGGAYDNCNTFHFLNGAFTLNNQVEFGPPALIFVAKLDGRYYDLNLGSAGPPGLGATIGDSCGHSGAVVAFGPEFRPPATVEWWLINSVTAVTVNPILQCTAPANIRGCTQYDRSRGIQIYPTNELHSPVQSPRITLTNIKPFELMIIVEDCTTAPDLALVSADMMDGCLNVAWVSGAVPGALKHAVHNAPAKVVGASTVGWQATQTVVATDVNGCGLVYLPNAKLVLVYDLNGLPKKQISNSHGNGLVSGWTTATVSTIADISGGGRGQHQGFAFVTSGSNLVFYQCRDNLGDAWTTPVIVDTLVRGPQCGGAWLGNAFAALYTRGNAVTFASTLNPGVWAGGADTGFTGRVCGMVRHPSGRLVGLVQAGAGGAVTALMSDDRGLTWSTSAAIGITPTPPPVLVGDRDGILYAVYIDTDSPHFKASQDGGTTWV